MKQKKESDEEREGRGYEKRKNKSIDLCVVIGGKAGDGIRKSGNVIARIFRKLGYNVYVYEDYPSLIKGGHNCSRVRVSDKIVECHKRSIDLLIAMDRESYERHKDELRENACVIYDSSFFEAEESTSIGMPFKKITYEKGYNLITRNSIAIGAMCHVFGIEDRIAFEVIKDAYKRHAKENIELFKIGYEFAKEKAKVLFKLHKRKEDKYLAITGNEAIGIGAIKAGLKAYIAYPMTPSTSLLHFFAANKDRFNIIVMQPENEIGGINIALGCAFAGLRSMVGTSGGGFALMVESLSLAAQAEIPMLFFVSQRPGPATGVPTYNMQGDLHFVLNAGHGEFLKVVASPGDAEEACLLGGELLNLAWKFQIPCILLADKELSESTYTFDPEIAERIKEGEVKLWNGKIANEGEEYKRYAITEDGVSPIAFPGTKGIITRATSYEHDEHGITTEEPEEISKMVEKRLRKRKAIEKEIFRGRCFNVYGNKNSEIAVITFGSTKGACREVCEELGIKLLQAIYLEPFPGEKIKKELENAEKIISVEINATGQLATLFEAKGIHVHERILKYDGRSFSYEELYEKLSRVI